MGRPGRHPGSCCRPALCTETDFGSIRETAVPLSDEERQAAAVDLERIGRGGIPLGAEQRLKRIAAASSPVFTSDLSAKEYAVAQASGLRADRADHGLFGRPARLAELRLVRLWRRDP